MATSTCPARCFTAIFNYWLSLWTQPGHLSPPVLLWTRCGHPPSPAPGEPVAWDGPYLMPEGAGWPVSPTHLQHPQLAARGCHLDPSQLSPTSSHLLLPEHPTWAAATWSLLSSHLPFAAVGCFFFAFQVPQLWSLLFRVWRTRFTHAMPSTLPSRRQAALFPHQLYPMSLQEGDSPPSQGNGTFPG